VKVTWWDYWQTFTDDPYVELSEGGAMREYAYADSRAAVEARGALAASRTGRVGGDLGKGGLSGEKANRARPVRSRDTRGVGAGRGGRLRAGR